MKHIWERLSQKGKKWRRLLKVFICAFLITYQFFSA